MSDEAKEIKRLEHSAGTSDCDCRHCLSVQGLAAIARRLLKERDAERKDNDHNVETIKLLGERIASLKLELEEARQKHNDHCRTTEVCYFSEKWRK